MFITLIELIIIVPVLVIVNFINPFKCNVFSAQILNFKAKPLNSSKNILIKIYCHNIREEKFLIIFKLVSKF